MRLSKTFLPILKDNPQDATIASHRLMLKSGMIRQLASGIYSWLPMGLKVLKKIENIIREEMNGAGAQELLMPTIQPADLWASSGRYEAYGEETLRMRDRHDKEFFYAPTAEEVVTDIFRQNIKSYKDLPLNLYQIQLKFRDEIRPRFGVMRGREFLMKDAYSFDLNFEGAQRSYLLMLRTYLKIFARLGLKAIPVKADSGAIGGDMSQEFHVLAETGESGVFYDKKYDEIDPSNIDIDVLQKLYAASDEKHDPSFCPISSDQIVEKRGIEVGHIFYLGTKYSEVLGAKVQNAQGELVAAHMGCYGIGVSRLVGAIIEANHDEYGIKWPVSVAPYQVSIVNLRVNDDKCSNYCESLYSKLKTMKIDVLYDDTDASAGAKFATHDLLGVPICAYIGPKSLENNQIEVKVRASGEKKMLSEDEFVNFLKAQK